MPSLRNDFFSARRVRRAARLTMASHAAFECASLCRSQTSRPQTSHWTRPPVDTTGGLQWPHPGHSRASEPAPCRAEKRSKRCKASGSSLNRLRTSSGAKRKVICVPGIFFDVNPFHRRRFHKSPYIDKLRMSYGPAWPNLKQAVKGMKEIIELAKAGQLPPLDEPED